MTARSDKRWLKSVADPDLVGFFEDSEFDAGEYAKGFYEQREASHAAHRVEKLEGLKGQTESALRAEVVRNYKAFMHATEEIRTMEAGIQTLKDLLGSTAVTLQTFRGVHLVEAVKPTEKSSAGRSTARAGRGAEGGAGGGGGEEEEDGGDEDGTTAAKGLKLPEWLDQSPIELEELLLERKHQEAASLIRRVRDFSANVQNATNLGRGVERIFQRVEGMAAGMAERLLTEISAANTLTVWGFREHKSNFALLISLGHGEQAAVFFVGERSAMIRRSLRLVEVTADPLSYVGVLSETFFGQVVDAVTAFIKLFCKSARIHERRSTKTGKSMAYYQIYQGVKDSGTAPFCRLVVWVNQQIDEYAVLMGRQIRAVTMGPQRLTSHQTGKRSAASLVSHGEEAGFRLGPVASSLFSIVSLMLEEGFAAAAVLNTMGFPVGVQLASRLVPDVTHFLSAYVDSVKDNLVEAIRKDPFVSAECRLVRPEALCLDSQEEEHEKAKTAQLTSSARILVLEARDILDYALVLLEPPPPDTEALGLPGEGEKGGGGSRSSPDGGANGLESQQAASYYTRDEFLELEPVIVTSLETLLRTYLKETIACMRARRDELSSHQSAAVVGNLAEMGASYVPLLAAWCAELLPEIAGEEEVDKLRSLRSDFQRSAQNPASRPRDTSSGSGRASGSGSASGRLPSMSSSSSSMTAATVSAGSAAPKATAHARSSSPPMSSSDRTSSKNSMAGSRRSSVASNAGGGQGGGGGGGGVVGGRSATSSRDSSPSSSKQGTARDQIPSLQSSLTARPSSFSGNRPPSTFSSAAAAAAAAASYTPQQKDQQPSASANNASGGSRSGRSSNASGKTTGANPSSNAPYTHSRRPSDVIAGPGGTSGSSSSSSRAPPSYSVASSSGGTTAESTAGPAVIASAGFRVSSSSSTQRGTAPPRVSASASAEAAARAAAAAARAATAASVGSVRSSVVPPDGGGGAAGGGGDGGTAQRRPTLTLKAAREMAQAKARAKGERK